MTQKEKAEAYDEVREKIALRFGSNVAEEIFSGFEKSEDEKTRKEICDFICWARDRGCITMEQRERVDSWIDCLEKQGEKESIPLDYDKAFDKFISHIPEKDPDSPNSLYTYEDLESAIQFGIAWQKEQKPAWSEKDEDKFNKVIDELTPYGECPDNPDWEEREYYYGRNAMIDWLKSLKGRLKGK